MQPLAEIDHIFVFATEGDGLVERLCSLGLVETYRRAHPGQGTRNICYAFDNAYLEVLFLTSVDEAQSPAIRRTGLLERSLWRARGTSQFGIAWRPAPGTLPAPDFAEWAYRPPYLPETLAIHVAVDGDDPHLPMVFRFPGTAAPITWPAERRGMLQHRAGFGTLGGIEISLPATTQPGPSLRWLAAQGALGLSQGSASGSTMSLVLKADGTGRSVRLELPSRLTL
jgi:hypothetical protein